jgi:hypothetical protein
MQWRMPPPNGNHEQEVVSGGCTASGTQARCRRLVSFTNLQQIRRNQMSIHRKLARLGGAAALLSCLALAFTSSAAAATTKITFKEPEKGSTFTFIDNAPKTKHKHGFPQKISAGDEFVFTNPLEAEGKKIGHLQAVCVATGNGKFQNAGFNCNGTFVFTGKGTLIAAATIAGKKTEGAITGGTGTYAGARGTFVSKEGKGASSVTVTLLE